MDQPMQTREDFLRVQVGGLVLVLRDGATERMRLLTVSAEGATVCDDDGDLYLVELHTVSPDQAAA